jgi:hypothetical protein
MTRQSLSRRNRLVFVTEEISLGLTLLQLAHTERTLGEVEVSSASLERSQAVCASAWRSLGELSCLLQGLREDFENTIGQLQSAISEFRTTTPSTI